MQGFKRLIPFLALFFCLFQFAPPHAQGSSGNRPGRTPDLSKSRPNFKGFLCSINDTLERPDVAIPIATISGTTKTLKIALGTMFAIEQQRKILEQTMGKGKVTLRAIGFWGPAKAFARAAIPFMDRSMRGLRTLQNPTWVNKLHKGVLTFDKGWTALSIAFLAIKGTAIGVCGEARFFGECIGKKCSLSLDGEPSPQSWFEGMDRPSTPQQSTENTDEEVDLRPSSCGFVSGKLLRILKQLRAQSNKVKAYQQDNQRLLTQTSRERSALMRQIRKFRSKRVNVSSLTQEYSTISRFYSGLLRTRSGLRNLQSRYIKRKKLIPKRTLSSFYHSIRISKLTLNLQRRVIRSKIKKLEKEARRPSLSGNQKRNKLYQLLTRSKGTFNALNSTCHSFSNAFVAQASAMRKIQGELQKVKRSTDDVKRKMDAAKRKLAPILKVTNEIASALRRRVCVTYGVRVRVRSWRIWKWKVRKKKFCFRVEQILKGVRGVLRPVNSLLNKAANKIMRPLIRKLTKRMPNLDFGNLNAAHNGLKKIKAPIERLMSATRQFNPGSISASNNKFKQIKQQIQSIRR